MPPLERASICSCAHSVARVIERCNDIVTYRSSKNLFGEKRNREAELCIRLSELIEENTMRLRHIKRPEELPDLIGFRKLINEARTAHSNLQKKLNSGIYPRSTQQSLCLLGKLRCELSRSFDELVEGETGLSDIFKAAQRVFNEWNDENPDGSGSIADLQQRLDS